jgi:hypothetical protein
MSRCDARKAQGIGNSNNEKETVTKKEGQKGEKRRFFLKKGLSASEAVYRL